jgi:hypothetical protein
MIGRALLAIAIAGTMLHHAGAQFGGPPAAPPAQCQELLTLRDELQKHGAAIETANQKKADVQIACRLFRRYIATEAKMLKMLDTDGSSCGVPAQVNQQVRGSHAKAQQIGKQVCDAAQRGPYQYDAPPIDDDERRPFRLDPDRRPAPWPGRLTERQS